MTETETTRDRPTARQRGFSIPFGRRGRILGAMALIGAGLWLNWGWVVAIGAAPLILAVAPCAVMCGLGLCAMCKSKGCAADKGPADLRARRETD